MKILIYSPSILPDRHFGTDLEIAKKHLDIGDEVHFFVCDTSMKYCEQNPYHTNNICYTCLRKQNHGIIEILNISNDKIHNINLSNFKVEIDFENIKTKEELSKFIYKDIDIGSATLSTLITILNNSNPDIEKNKEIMINMLKTGISLYESTLKILSDVKPDIFYLFNGRTITRRPALRAGQKLGIKTYIQEASGELDLYSLTENAMPHELDYMKKEIINHWNINDNLEYKKLIATNWYDNRRKGQDQAWYSFTKEQIKDKLPINFDLKKTNIAIFNTSDDEFEEIGPEWKDTIFSNQNETIKNIVLHYINDDSIHFYLRVHPNLKNINNYQTQKIKELNYKNLTIINAESTIDSYNLMNVSNKILIFSSTMGIEASFYNKVVILLGRSFYEDLGSTYKPKSYSDLFTLIKNDIKPLNNLGAIIYGYWLATWGYKYKYYKPTSIMCGTFNNKSLSDFNFNQEIILHIIDKYWSFYDLKFKDIISKNTLISIIIIDVGQNLDTQISNIEKSSHKNYEIIIISKNKDLKLMYEHIIYLNQDSNNISILKNKAIEISRGEYLFFIDKEIFLFEHTFEFIIKSAIKYKSDLLYGNFIYFEGFNYIENNQSDINDYNKIEFFRERLNTNNIVRSSYIIKREVLIEYNGFDKHISQYEEEDIINRLIISKDRKIHKVNFPIYCSFKNIFNKVDLDSYFLIFNKIIKSIGINSFLIGLNYEKAEIYFNTLRNNYIETNSYKLISEIIYESQKIFTNTKQQNNKDINSNKKLSLCVIAKNEEKNIARCLKSVRGVVDEIIVVDTGSSDKTVQIAKRYGAKVFYYEWCNDFASARNYSIDKSTGDWILILDADEELAPISKKNIRSLMIESNLSMCFNIKIKNISQYSDKEYDVENYMTRFFNRNEKNRYIGKIHERIDNFPRNLPENNIFIIHHGYKDKEFTSKKQTERNLPILENILSDKNISVHDRIVTKFYFAISKIENEEYSIAEESLLDILNESKTVNISQSFLVMIYIELIYIYYLIKNFEKFEKFVIQAELDVPLIKDISDYWCFKGLIEYKKENFEQAIKLFTKSIELNVNKVQSNFSKASGVAFYLLSIFRLCEIGVILKNNEILNKYSKLFLTEAKNYPTYLINLSSIYFNLQEYDKALDLNKDILNSLLKKYGDKIDKYEKGLRKIILNNMSKIYMIKNLFDEAIEIQSQIHSPEDVKEQWFNLAKTLEEQNNYFESEKVYSSIIKILPNESMAYLYRAKSKMAQGNKDIVNDLDMSYKYSKENKEKFIIISTYLQIGYIQKAYSCIKDLIELHPTNYELKLYLADIELKLNNIQKSEKILTELIYEYPDLIEIYSKLGNLYFSNGNLDKANEVFESSLNIEPNNSNSLYYLTIINIELDNNEKAYNYVQKALEIQPENEELLYFYEKLKE